MTAQATPSNTSIVLYFPGRQFFYLSAETKSLQLHTPQTRKGLPTDRLTLRFSSLWSCRGSWVKFPQRLCFAFCVGSCAEGVRFAASRKIPIYLKILESLRGHKAEQSSSNPSGSPETAAGSALSSFSALQLSRGFLCLRTMLLRHPHAAPRNALQRKMAGGGAELE